MNKGQFECSFVSACTQTHTPTRTDTNAQTHTCTRHKRKPSPLVLLSSLSETAVTGVSSPSSTNTQKADHLCLSRKCYSVFWQVTQAWFYGLCLSFQTKIDASNSWRCAQNVHSVRNQQELDFLPSHSGVLHKTSTLFADKRVYNRWQCAQSSRFLLSH